MIRENSIDLLYDLFSDLFSCAFKNKINENTFESILTTSKIVKDLENSDDSFLYSNNSYEDLAKETFKSSYVKDYKRHNTSLTYWLGEAYIRLFIKFKKSFYFLFLYLPISNMKLLFNKYHEVSWDYLYEYFIKVCQSHTIIKLLLKRKRLTLSQLSILTNININTILKYNKKNDYLYNASGENIYILSKVLNVNPNLFLKSLNICIDSSIYNYDKFNKIYRSYLGMYYLSYFDYKVADKDYKYDKKNNIFSLDKHKDSIIVRFVDYKSKISLLELALSLSKEISNKEYVYLILFDYSDNSLKSYNLNTYKKLGFNNIYIINKTHFLNTKTGKNEILDNYMINESLINNAKMATFQLIENDSSTISATPVI